MQWSNIHQWPVIKVFSIMGGEKWAALSFLLQKQCLWHWWWCSPIPVPVQVLYFPDFSRWGFYLHFSSYSFPGHFSQIERGEACLRLFRWPGHQTGSEKYRGAYSQLVTLSTYHTRCVGVCVPPTVVCRHNAGRIRGTLFLSKWKRSQ